MFCSVVLVVFLKKAILKSWLKKTIIVTNMAPTVKNWSKYSVTK